MSGTFQNWKERIFYNNGQPEQFRRYGATHSISKNGAAVELSVAMPLSWLPLISDYTKDAKKPVKASAVSAVVYTLPDMVITFVLVVVVSKVRGRGNEK